MDVDVEIKAMANIAQALSGLDDEVVRRVLKWANDRYGVRPSLQSAVTKSPAGIPTEIPSYDDFAGLFHACNPQTAMDRALVAGYWFQVVSAEADLDSSVLNRELKNLGHPSTNITRDLDSLGKRTPLEVMQVSKSGRSKQARKRYRLTTAGIRTVERMLQGAAEGATA